ncbi:MAG: haloacid dehalogenase-like hydrolase [Candidatus Wildermuthbacteria bacterium]|nr:haloacid dehalogenase-like hydrolase [Candidatus Wildermuthbacteria bacterium]
MNIAFFDVDQTMLEGFSGSDMCSHFEKIGVFPKGYTEWDTAMVERYKRGEVSYHDISLQVLERLTSYFKGRTTREVSDLMNQYAGLVTHKIFPWVYPVIEALKNKNFGVALISASTDPFVQILSRHIGADYVAASAPEIQNGAYTGTLSRFLNGTEKVAAIEKIIGAEHPEYTIGFGDSTGDIPMLERVTYAFWHEPEQEEVLAMTQNRTNWFVATRHTMEQTVHDVLNRMTPDKATF